EFGVESAYVREESAASGVGRARAFRVGIEKPHQIPVTIRRELPGRVDSGRYQIPEVVRRRDAAREPAAHPDDRDRFVAAPLTHLRARRRSVFGGALRGGGLDPGQQ